MRICVSGTANTGKSTLINDFLDNWGNYKTPSSNYRELLKDKKYPHSKKCNKEGQWAILNHMIDELQTYDKKDDVIFDRGPLDNLVYSLWAHEKKSSDIDKEFIDKCIPLVKESLNYLDLIFFLPITKSSPIQIEDDGKRETDPIFIEEIDNIFKGLYYQYQHNLGRTPFFNSDNCPAIIEIFGKPTERIHLISQYLDVDGSVYGQEEDVILNPNNLMEMEELLKQQESTYDKEQKIKEQERLVREYIKKTKNNN